jgi:hypothetical protein
MKKEKQQLVLEILDNGKYWVDHERGVLQSFRKNLNEWVDCVHTLLPSGYKQNIIHLGRGQNTKITVYLHNLVWLACNGPFSEDKVVKCKDGDFGNCSLGNLELLSLSESSVVRPKSDKGTRVIRYDEITAIKKLLEENPSWSKSQVARSLGLNRISVARVINKIKNGEELKFEVEGKVRSYKKVVPEFNIKSIDVSITEINKGEYKLIGTPGKTFQHESKVDFEKWEDMPVEEINKEAIPHYKEKFGL